MSSAVLVYQTTGHQSSTILAMTLVHDAQLSGAVVLIKNDNTIQYVGHPHSSFLRYASDMGMIGRQAFSGWDHADDIAIVDPVAI